MRRSTTVAAAAFFLSIALSVSAQMRGGMGAGAGRVGGAPGFGRGFGSQSFNPGMGRSLGHQGLRRPFNFEFGPFSDSFFFPENRFFRNSAFPGMGSLGHQGLRRPFNFEFGPFSDSFFFPENRFFRNSAFFGAFPGGSNYGYGYPFGYFGYIGLPLGGAYPSLYAQDQSYPQQAGQTENAYEIAALAQRVEVLNNKLDRFLSANEESSHHAIIREAPRESNEQSTPILVFRDKHVEQVKNYAVVDKTLWIFDARTARKIPLSDLDLDATTKLNAERGIPLRDITDLSKRASQ
jgi:hypothetical protein